MASNSETGHAINISNFKKMIDFCTAYGPDYLPSNVNLKVPNMTTKWTTANTAHSTLTTAIQTARNPINARVDLFKPLNKLVTKANASLQSTDASVEIKKDVKALADKIRGSKTSIPKLDDGNPDPDDVSNSHLSYVSKQDNFKQFIDLLKTEPKYNPNETDIKTTELTTYSDSLKTSNDNIGTILAPIFPARGTRNDALYAPTTGIFDTSALCKEYVKSAFGSSSEQYKQVRKLKFTPLKE